MSAGLLSRSAEVSAADWLGLRNPFEYKVANIVPAGFPAYVRVLHPARGSADDEQVRWATIAGWSGRTMHPLAQFHAIARPRSQPPPGDPPWDGHDPRCGNLEAERLRALAKVLADHTQTPERCWFCLWEGWGFLTDKVRHGPLVHHPVDRNYLLFEGPLKAVTDLEEPFGHRSFGHFFAQSPSLFWPQDHAWCVGTEIDLFCTIVAGSEALADALHHDPLLETLQVNADDPIHYNSDVVNT